jgi:hypothetical protein
MNPGKWNLRVANTQVLSIAVLALLALFAGSAGFAKDRTPQTRTVRGVTTDESDNLIQGAAIQLIDVQTKKVLDVYSGQGGQYQFTDLRFDHDYTIKATYKNLSSDTRQVSSLDIRTPLEMNLILHKPGK